jgi:hypothetical protein
MESLYSLQYDQTTKHVQLNMYSACKLRVVAAESEVVASFMITFKQLNVTGLPATQSKVGIDKVDP